VPRGDEPNYLSRALHLYRQGVLDTGDFVRPPLYFALLAGLHALSAPFDWRLALVARLAQALAGAAAAVPVYRCARRLSGARAARLAAACLLFDPTLVAYTHLLWPETFFLLLVAVVFDGVAGLERRPPWRACALGAVTGLALLLKPAFGLFTLLLAAFWLWRLGLRGALRLTLLFGGAAALVVAPWVVRNQLRYGPAILLENQAPYNLWIGNDPAPPLQILQEWQALPDPVTRSRVANERGRAAIAADPAGFVRHSAVRALNLWGLEFFVLRHAVIGGYGELGRADLLRVFWLLQLSTLLLFVAAALGLRRALRDESLRLLAVYAAVFTLVVSALVTTTRFRVPFAFLLCVSAGLGLDALFARRLAWRDAAAAACALCVLSLSATRPLFRTLGSGDFEQVEELRRVDWTFFRY
jgi:4-amino-4-deoxy-L-arabinose transferase-like glycosyltransferase